MIKEEIIKRIKKIEIEHAELIGRSKQIQKVEQSARIEEFKKESAPK